LGAALASSRNDATLADIASLVDLFWIGGTKAGALLGEAIVVCNPALKANHDALPAGFAQHFRDPAFIAHEGAARRLAFEFRATRQSGHFLTG
jgi:threonine aldolase